MITPIYQSYHPGTIEEHNTQTQLESVLVDVNDWMNENRLKMNTGKTEFILRGSRQQLLKSNFNSITVVQDNVHCSDTIRLLGTWLDSNLNMNKHATVKYRVAMVNLPKIKQIRKYLDMNTNKILVDSLITSHLDYCNSLLFGATKQVLHKFQ